MFILQVAEITLDSTAQVARYRGKLYRRSRTCSTLEDAVGSCRQDLDSGRMSLVVKEPQQFSVWAVDGNPLSESNPSPSSRSTSPKQGRGR